MFKMPNTLMAPDGFAGAVGASAAAENPNSRNAESGCQSALPSACTLVWAADSADCTGLVVDENGAPVATSQIKLEHSSGQAYRTETDGAGRFSLRNLLTGGYRAEVRKQGFFVLSNRAVSLHLGLNEITFTLNHSQEVREQVQVAAPANQIDTHDTSQHTALTAPDIRDVPVPNTHVLAESLIVGKGG